MNIQISNSSEDPIYLQIKKQVKAQILSGDLSVGDQLPSIRFVAKELRISMLTVKRAFDELEQEGFIDSVQGKGTFVSGQNKDLIREEYLKSMEEKLEEMVDLAKLAGLSNEKILEIVKGYLEGDYGRI